jgi:peptidoglycan/LPS O-acetylase OafA/YrhL
MLWNGDFQYLVGLPVAYATIYIGLIIKQRSFVSTISDYSYGIYLFGVPIQQMAALWFPAYRKYWLVTGFVGPLLITTAIAAISWRLLESPILEKRKVIIANCEKTLQKLTGRANAKAASYPTSSSEGRARGPST